MQPGDTYRRVFSSCGFSASRPLRRTRNRCGTRAFIILNIGPVSSVWGKSGSSGLNSRHHDSWIDNDSQRSSEWRYHTLRWFARGFAAKLSGAAPHNMSANHMNKPPSIIPPRGLNIRQTSAYWGVSPGTFKKLVRLGLAPAPSKLPGLDRNIYDRIPLDAAMTAMS